MDPVEFKKLQDCKKLVALVARAFYEDQDVVFLDALVEHKYMINEYICSQLSMHEKEKSKIINRLLTEKLIKKDDVYLEGTESHGSCFYIDYQSFADVVRYRLFLMRSIISNQLKKRVEFECPSCNAKYGELEVLKYRTKDFRFVCPRCCPFSNFSSEISEPQFCLKSKDNSEEQDEYKSLDRKMGIQLGKITNLLNSLRDVDLPRNRPADNHNLGVKVQLTNQQKENVTIARVGKNTSGSQMRSKDQKLFENSFIQNNTESNVNIHIEESKTSLSNITSISTSSIGPSNNSVPIVSVARTYDLPASLNEGSRVVGADTITAGLKRKLNEDYFEGNYEKRIKLVDDPIVKPEPNISQNIKTEENAEVIGDDNFEDVEWDTGGFEEKTPVVKEEEKAEMIGDDNFEDVDWQD